MYYGLGDGKACELLTEEIRTSICRVVNFRLSEVEYLPHTTQHPEVVFCTVRLHNGEAFTSHVTQRVSHGEELAACHHRASVAALNQVIDHFRKQRIGTTL